MCCDWTDLLCFDQIQAMLGWPCFLRPIQCEVLKIRAGRQGRQGSAEIGQLLNCMWNCQYCHLCMGIMVLRCFLFMFGQLNGNSSGGSRRLPRTQWRVAPTRQHWHRNIRTLLRETLRRFGWRDGMLQRYLWQFEEWNTVGIAIINNPIVMVYTTHIWWLGGWFIITIPTLLWVKQS